MNMYEFIKDRKQFIPESRLKAIMFQLFKALDHMHSNQIFHRDLKPENILVSGETVKLADFGSCKSMLGSLPCTEYISTRWYRPPECLMTDGYYDYKMDIWGAGCVFFEVLALYPLFQGANELDQVHKIHDVLGTPDLEVLKDFESKASHMKFEFTPKTGTGIEKLIPHVSAQCKDLINQMLAYKACDRITAAQVLKHPYFRNFHTEDRKSLTLENVSNTSTSNEKGFSILPAIKNSFSKKKEKSKNDASSHALGFISKSPYSMKKSIMELKKAYAPPEKKFYKSSY